METISIARGGGFEAFVTGFEAGTVERLLQCFAGENAEGMGDASLLLRLPDAACDLVVDRFVVGGFTAEETTESDDSVEFFAFSEGASGGRDLPGARDADDLNLILLRRFGGEHRASHLGADDR